MTPIIIMATKQRLRAGTQLLGTMSQEEETPPLEEDGEGDDAAEHEDLFANGDTAPSSPFETRPLGLNFKL